MVADELALGSLGQREGQAQLGRSLVLGEALEVGLQLLAGGVQGGGFAGGFGGLVFKLVDAGAPGQAGV